MSDTESTTQTEEIAVCSHCGNKKPVAGRPISAAFCAECLAKAQSWPNFPPGESKTLDENEDADTVFEPRNDSESEEDDVVEREQASLEGFA